MAVLLTTARLVLRQFTDADVEQIVNVVLPHFVEYAMTREGWLGQTSPVTP